MNSIPRIPTPVNEPVRGYLCNSTDREELKNKLSDLSSECIDIPLIIGGKEIRTGNTATNVMPHNHGHTLCTYHKASKTEIDMAIRAAASAKPEWELMPWTDRAAIFLKAAELVSGKYRSTLNAATMLGQSKTLVQAEIDSACELIDFWRFNAKFLQEIYAKQPISSPGIWNRVEYRPLEGFVFAVTPFNFTAIAGNLPTAPAMMGNTVVWKPASSSVYSGYFIMKILQEAGLPEGVINFIPCPGSEIGDSLVAHPDFAGIHFTGSTSVFQGIWKQVGENIHRYKSYPRIVGETGGKDFIFAHSSCDVEALVTALVRGAFEYQGQKCSAASRAYVPASIWTQIETTLVEKIRSIKIGPVEDFQNFMSAVIDKNSFDNIKRYIEKSKADPHSTILVGGETDDRDGYYVKPTLIKAAQPDTLTMREEIFGPILSVYVYDDAAFEETLKICDQTSSYALTGAIFANDRKAVILANQTLRHSAGNFYINDKPTGAVVGQQPFGGGRASGTNDKAGSPQNLLRWSSTRTIKETFAPPNNIYYPYMSEG